MYFFWMMLIIQVLLAYKIGSEIQITIELISLEILGVFGDEMGLNFHKRWYENLYWLWIKHYNHVMYAEKHT